MSKAYKCDRCGKFYLPGICPKYYVRQIGDENGKDLCPDCNDTLHKWINNEIQMIVFDGKEENDAEVFKAGNETE